MKRLTHIRMLALDIDGTLMDKDKHFPEINRRALQACEQRGMRIALVSGRSFELMRLFARELGIHPLMVACNGTRIEAGENGPTLSETTFTSEAAQRILDVLTRSGLYFNAYRRGKCYMGNPEMQHVLGKRYAHHVPGMSGDAAYPYETVCDRDRLEREGICGAYKYVAMGEPYDPAFGTLREQLSDMRLSISSASKRNIEFMPSDVDKGSALHALCAYTGIDENDVAAFGDQTNDLPMLRAAGVAVAMENAEEAVKAEATYIAPDHNLGGVGLFLYQYVLGDEE